MKCFISKHLTCVSVVVASMMRRERKPMMRLVFFGLSVFIILTSLSVCKLVCNLQEGEEEADEENDPDYEPKVRVQMSISVPHSSLILRSQHTEYILSPPLTSASHPQMLILANHILYNLLFSSSFTAIFGTFKRKMQFETRSFSCRVDEWLQCSSSLFGCYCRSVQTFNLDL